MAEKPTSNREGADDYGRVVVILSDDARVVAGSCGLQWILQRLVSGKWRNKLFFRSKAGLLLYARRLCQAPGALETLDSLPEWFPEAGGYPWWPGKLGKTAPPAWPQAEDEEGWPKPLAGQNLAVLPRPS